VACPFCNSVIHDAVLVCPACQRDVAVPAALIKERDELLGRRARLVSDLAEAKAALASRGAFRLRSRD
jgi:hypothetical protein